MHAIIAGANKAGTTSLFRYLADHPDVCPSSVKETNFFLSSEDDGTPAALEKYAGFFAAASGARVLLEGSPIYLSRAPRIAARLKHALPEARLIFMLREPASRLMSYVRVNRQNLYKEAVAALDDEAYIALVEEIARTGAEPPDPGPQRNAFLQYQRGNYAAALDCFFHAFDADRIHIAFLDDLRDDPQAFMRRVAGFLDLDVAFYDDYNFAVENRTREHRWPRLQKWVSRINMRLEPFLNRHPGLRGRLRAAYERLNERRGKSTANPLSAQSLRRLQAVYRKPNAELAALMTRHYPDRALPSWLRDQRNDR